MGRKPVSKVRKADPETKEKWVRTLIPLFIKHGLRKFTMNEVCSVLKVSKATLYKHFTSRHEILEKALEVKLADIGSFKDQLFDDSQDYVTRYFSSLDIFFHEISGISNEFLADLKHSYPDIWTKVEFFREYAANLMKQFYQQGIEKGYLNDIDPSLIVVTEKIFFEKMSDPDFLMDNNLTLQEAFRNYFTLRSKGLFRTREKEQFDKRVDNFIRELPVQ